MWSSISINMQPASVFAKSTANLPAFLSNFIVCRKPFLRSSPCIAVAFSRRISAFPYKSSKPIKSFSFSVVAMGAVADEAMSATQKRLMFEDECILVDTEDRVVGHDSKYNCHLMEKIESENVLHRAFSVFLFNSNLELLLQQRSATKVTFPLVWTNTCCSHPLYRESELIEENYLGIKNAAQRKLYDELGIAPEDLPVDQFVPLGRILYKAPSDGKWGEHEFWMFKKKQKKCIEICNPTNLLTAIS
eukprot:TRINITY_DN896_c0_g1_i2.p1 TRINITY_DN896_c0_g1~~TRINITY_DN896_c0_g1_i2.p1  ORF type:complete len:247 (+),score=29.43 TRINITY_DN896_c0_g1_i2:299-1039(+)